MTDQRPPDPGAFFREMLSQWESLANDWGGKVMKSGEFARTVHGATGAATQARDALQMGFGKALAAANMPSREEIEGLSERLGAIEARLGNIESLLVKLAGGAAAPVPMRPQPRRTRKPPVKP